MSLNRFRVGSDQPSLRTRAELPRAQSRRMETKTKVSKVLAPSFCPETEECTMVRKSDP